MIQDLLREIVGEPWVERIDFDSGEKLGASFASNKHEHHESDVLWKFRRQDGGELVYVYLLLAFQSRPDPSIAVRLMGYESLFYQSLLASHPAAEWRKLPPVIPVLLYRGREPWNVATDLGSLIGDLDPSVEIYRPQLRYRLVDAAAYPLEKLIALNNPVAELFLIERSRDWEEARARLPRLRQNIPADEASLRRTFAAWLQRVILPRFGLSPEEFSATLTLEELEERVRTADTERLLDWGERVLTAQSLQDVFRD
jgi:hypothetical protein